MKTLYDGFSKTSGPHNSNETQATQNYSLPNSKDTKTSAIKLNNNEFGNSQKNTLRWKC